METLDRIQSELAEIEVLTAQLAARRLTLLASADALQAAFVDGARTMGEWVARTLDCEVDTARRLVRTARAISGPVLDRLAAGEITVERAGAYTEAALVGLDPDRLDGLELAGVRHLCRRRCRPGPVDRYLVVQPQLDEAAYRVHGRLDAVQGAVVTAALEAEMDRLSDGVPVAQRPARSELRADALTSICEGGERRVVVSVHQNAEGTVEVDGVAASPGVLDHAGCVGTVDTVGDVPRIGVRVSRPQRRQILHRDQHRCTVDGCSSRSRLEIHHIVHRSRGGDHDDDNLTTLCWFHHHVVVHRRGFRVEPSSPPGRRRLRPP